MPYTVYSAFFYFLLHVVFDIFYELLPACVVCDILQFAIPLRCSYFSH